MFHHGLIRKLISMTEAMKVAEAQAAVNKLKNFKTRRPKAEVVRAAFTEQGASASQLVAVRVLETVSKLFAVAGEANGAVSSHTQVRMSEASSVILWISYLWTTERWLGRR